MKRTETIYGFFPGGDPREFSPDNEACTEEELTAWRQACDAWTKAEVEGLPNPDSLPACRPLITDEGQVVGRAIHRSFGLGVYTFEFDDEEEAEGQAEGR